MKKFFLNIWREIKAPHMPLILAVYILCVLFVIATIVTLAISYMGPLAYVFYAAAAVTLGYSVYLTVRFSGKLKAAVSLSLKKNRHFRRFLEQYDFRTLVFAAFSLILNISYSVFFGVTAILSHTVWYGSLAAYYLFLTLMRGGIVFYHGKRRKKGSDYDGELKKYGTTAILLSVLPICLSFAIGEMIINNSGYSYGGITIYAVAAYTFYKLTMSVINMVKAQKSDKLTVKAVRAIGLADAGVSLLALQSAMFNSFGGGGESTVMNAVTGVAVSVLTFAIGISMLVNYIKIKNKKKHEENKI